MTEVQPPPWMEGWEPAAKPEKPVRSEGNPNWYPGMPSPNPAGRPRGITDRKAKLVQRMLDDADSIVDAIIGKALEGDAGCGALILSRILPTVKAQSEKVRIEGFDTSQPVSAQVEAVLMSVAEGNVSADVAKQIVDGISSLSNIRNSEQLEARIADLENRVSAK
ncbi:hypothetical protein L6Q21_10275 [Sandaracinobacter sp. RS1-74]|uniref:hypothetical protein n=1 Tax=Sandaracinobacteroides sayramensis TaxID=2913411 RepID=UPI001EDB5E88|nr:hypothetical protein [Sandaracinobacteroides sayramensis]MCG2841366.1 hypothetical protein [Sandaracinobacteroides sayramensis]